MDKTQKNESEFDKFANQFKRQQYELTQMGDGTAVLLSIESGKIITLNEVATSIVDLMINDETENITESLLLDRLMEEYDVPAEVLKKDLSEFIQKLASSL